MQRVLSAFALLESIPSYSVVGNHELYNFNREQLCTSGLNVTGTSGRTYHVVSIRDWDLIFLDAFDVSLCGHEETHPRYQEALELIRANNPRIDMLLADPNLSWSEGLPEGQEHWVPHNGGVSAEQLSFLRASLEESRATQRSAVIFSHVPLHEPASQRYSLLWNHSEVMKILHEFADTVCAVFAGHEHDGGYAVDECGIHHVTMCAPLLADVGAECWATLELSDEEAVLRCAGVAVAARNGTGHYPELNLAKGASNRPQRRM